MNINFGPKTCPLTEKHLRNSNERHQEASASPTARQLDNEPRKRNAASCRKNSTFQRIKLPLSKNVIKEVTARRKENI